MDILKAIEALWPVFVFGISFGVGAIIWFVRTDVRIKALERELSEHKAVYSKGKDDVWLQMRELNKTMGDIRNALSRIEGKIEAKEHA